MSRPRITYALTGDGTKTYEWDAEDRLTAVKQGGATLASFTYDGGGRRVTKSAGGITTTNIYDGQKNGPAPEERRAMSTAPEWISLLRRSRVQLRTMSRTTSAAWSG